MTVGKRRAYDESEQLDPEFIEFAKAYYRYKCSHSPTQKGSREIGTLKTLEAALVAVTKSGSIRGLSFLVLDEAAVIARRHYVPPIPVSDRPTSQGPRGFCEPKEIDFGRCLSLEVPVHKAIIRQKDRIGRPTRHQPENAF